MKAVELENVSFRYDKNGEDILKNIDFSIEYGSLVLLSGVSGSGKSTLLSLICGIIPEMIKGEIKGNIKINGKSTQNLTMSEKCSQIGVVLQNADLQILNDIVEDELAFGMENIGMPCEQINETIENVCKTLDIDRLAKTRVLSGGQKQRIITGSILAMGQKILILDEPLANLDFKASYLLMNKLKQLADSGYAVIIIEHRIDMLKSFVDNIFHMENGRLERVENISDYYEKNKKEIPIHTIRNNREEKIISINNLSITKGKKNILDNISFDIFKGEKLLILGENGAGKTTLVRCISRLIKTKKGVINQYIDEKIGARASKEWYRKVGVVYQNPNYQLFMPTVYQEVLFGAKNKDFGEKIIKLFRLEHLLDRHPQSLSEGQKRLVSIASVCASDPKVLVLDEPTVGQDYDGLNRLVNILNEIHNLTHNTIITITHDKRCAKAFCDRCIEIKNGKYVKEGDINYLDRYFSNQNLDN